MHCVDEVVEAIHTQVDGAATVIVAMQKGRAPPWDHRNKIIIGCGRRGAVNTRPTEVEAVGTAWLVQAEEAKDRLIAQLWLVHILQQALPREPWTRGVADQFASATARGRGLGDTVLLLLEHAVRDAQRRRHKLKVRVGRAEPLDDASHHRVVSAE